MTFDYYNIIIIVAIAAIIVIATIAAIAVFAIFIVFATIIIKRLQPKAIELQPTLSLKSFAAASLVSIQINKNCI